MSILEGKRCLVVGAGSGIGRGVFDAFLAEGAQVAAMEIDAGKCAALLSAAPQAVVESGDATSWDDAERTVDAAVAAFGGLDVLVNCVGLFDYSTRLEDLDRKVFDAAFDESMRVNVLSHILSVRHAIPHLRESKGTVILTGSTSGFALGSGGVLYVASKYALRGVVASLAKELAPEIRVNAVAPGGTTGTDLRGLRALGQQDRSLGDTPDRAADIKGRSPLDVALNSSDHAHSYVFLASDGARGMSGRFLHPDGGVNIKNVSKR